MKRIEFTESERKEIAREVRRFVETEGNGYMCVEIGGRAFVADVESDFAEETRTGCCDEETWIEEVCEGVRFSGVSFFDEDDNECRSNLDLNEIEKACVGCKAA